MSDHSLSEFEPEETEEPPLRATVQFFPDGATCEACGETVTRRWHDDGQFVCADCKAW